MPLMVTLVRGQPVSVSTSLALQSQEVKGHMGHPSRPSVFLG